MEVSTLFLQRLSIIFQLSVVVLLALFFAVLARSVRLQEVRLWATAWLCNALGLTGVLFITFSPGIVLLDRLAIIGFLMGKTGYVILLVFGARHHLRPGLEPQYRRHLLVLFLFVWGVGLGFAVPSIFFAHIAQTLLVGVVLASGGVTVLRNPRSPISRWLGWALLLQGAVFLHVLAVIVPLMWGGEPVFNYIRIQSFFDAVTELFVALACLVAVADRSAEQMRATNLELEESHLRLSRLVDLDPLTGLANR
ncbi:MAG: hypothetical protein GY906_25045, partial [bacterium]|nr:hypothetical protein [bacterium]